MPLLYATPNHQHANAAAIANSNPSLAEHIKANPNAEPTHFSEHSSLPGRHDLCAGRTELTLEIKHTSSGFYASISSVQQLINQTGVYQSYAKATQEGYRLIESLQRDSLSCRQLFN
jgi:hypothetical protein